MAASWSSVENAIQAWITRTTGLEAVWAHQSAPRPKLPFVTLRHDGGHAVGGVDEVSQAYVSTAPAGQEIQLTTRPQIELAVSVQVFTAPVTGDASAFALLSKARAALSSPIQVDDFVAAGLAMVERGPVQNLTDLLETRFEGRAALDVRFRLVDGFTDTTGYIATLGPVGVTLTE